MGANSRRRQTEKAQRRERQRVARGQRSSTGRVGAGALDSELHSAVGRVVDALVDLRRRGRRVAALVVDTSDLLPSDPELALARRFWALELARRERMLGRAGIVTTRWHPGEPLAQAIALLARVAHRPMVRTAGLHGGTR